MKRSFNDPILLFFTFVLLTMYWQKGEAVYYLDPVPNKLSVYSMDSTVISVERADQLLMKLLESDPWKQRPDASSLAWGEAATLNAVMDMFEATGNKKYLDILAKRGNQLMSYRDDKRGVADMSGNIRPGWSMGSKYVVAAGAILNSTGDTIADIKSATYSSNLSTSIEIMPENKEGRYTIKVDNKLLKRSELFENISLNSTNSRFIENIVNDPMSPYSAAPGNVSEKSNLIKIKIRKAGVIPPQKIELKPLPLAYTGYLGIIYQPLLRFSEAIKKDTRLSELNQTADYFIRSAEESYRDANKRVWRNGPGADEGYYITCEKGESFPADNVGQPFNYLGKHVCALLSLYRLTKKNEYYSLSEKMCWLFKKRLSYYSANDLYIWKYWYEPMTTTGWTPKENISSNTSYFKPAPHIEDISHGVLDIAMVAEAYKQRLVFDSIDMKRFANTVLKNILIPGATGVRRKVDGEGEEYDPYFPALFGWLELSDANEEVYVRIKNLYTKRNKESFLFSARLLKWKKRLGESTKIKGSL
jgi:hypothetical protein